MATTSFHHLVNAQGVLETILRYAPGQPLVNLWCTGDTLVRYKLANVECTSIKLNNQAAVYMNRLPVLMTQMRNLKSLSIQRAGAFPISLEALMTMFKTINPNLVKLELDFKGLDSAFLHKLCQHFIHLKSLILPMTIVKRHNDDLFKLHMLDFGQLPRTLEELVIGNGKSFNNLHDVYQLYLSQFKNMPPNLQQLDINGGGWLICDTVKDDTGTFDVATKVEMPDVKSDFVKLLPSNLTSFTWKMYNTQFLDLPRTLTQLDCQYIPLELLPLLKTFPLVRLSLTIGEAKTIGDRIRIHRANDDSLWTTLTGAHLSLLPKTITDLRFGVDKVDWLSIDTKCWPLQLKKLDVYEQGKRHDMVGVPMDYLHVLPSTLTDVEVCIGVISPQISWMQHQQRLSHLPPSLTRLYLRYRESHHAQFTPVNWLLDFSHVTLPKTLKHLSIHVTTHDLYQFTNTSTFPVTLHWDDHFLPNNLESLSIRGCDRTLLTLGDFCLSNSLKQLVISGNTTFSDAFWQPDIMLPQSLESLIWCLNTQDEVKQLLRKLPATLLRLLLKGSCMSGFSRNATQEAPFELQQLPQSLKDFDMAMWYIEAHNVHHLPPKLEYLNADLRSLDWQIVSEHMPKTLKVYTTPSNVYRQLAQRPADMSNLQSLDNLQLPPRLEIVHTANHQMQSEWNAYVVKHNQVIP
jgi:hypothetical protein